jgi:hypothetical protein
MNGPYPIGTVVLHKNKPEFGYGIIVFSFPQEAPESYDDISEAAIAVVLWHGDEEEELTDTPQVHPYSELKILNTTVGFA